jgi:tetratricopeptide (TPR) repeat protein
VAQYARARAEEAGDWEAAVRAHAAHFLAVAEEAAPRYCGGEQVDALGRVDAEHPNLTAAVERSLALGESGDAGRLCWALWMYWWLRGHHALGARLSEAVLAHGVPPAVRAHTSLAAATMRFAMDDVPAALGWWEQAVEHAVDPTALANGIAGTGLAALATGDLVTARARFAEARVPAEEAGDEGEWTWALSLVWSGTVDLLEGDFDAAVAHIERGLASARRRGDRLTSYIALYNLSQVEMARGRRGEARRHLEEGMRLSLETGDQSNLAYLLDATAVLEAAEGTLGRVPLLLGAAQAIREAVGSRGYGYYRPDPAAGAAAADEARRHLGADRYDDALDTGRGLAPEEAAGLVLGRVPTASPATPGR